MNRISSMQDLVRYGINPLTGEACAYSMRILCDLSEKGCQLVADYLGMPYDPELPRWQEFRQNWNTMVGDSVAVASILLVRDVLPSLSRFALFHVDNCDYVAVSPDGTYIGLHCTDEYCEKYLALARSEATSDWQLYTNFSRPAGNPANGGRNQHAFTGRTE